MKAIIPFIAAVALVGCESVELQYSKPAEHGKFDEIESQANDKYEFFVFPKTYILVTPVLTEEIKADDQTITTSSTIVEKSKADNVKKKTNTPPPGQATNKSPPTTSGTETTSVRPVANDLSSATIDGKRWQAKVVQLPDLSRAITVRGVSGFWKSTAIGITKYPNTDMVSSVSSTAENLVPKRLGQVASVVGTAIKIGALLASGAEVNPTNLQPFLVEIPQPSGKINRDWIYTFKYDEPPPPATISLDTFIEKTTNRTVSYWPVPACRSATLEIQRNSDKSRTAFHVTVSSADNIRLQPLPIKGKIELGSICGSTMSGTATTDNFSTFSDDFQALQQAIKTIKDARKAASDEDPEQTK